MTTSHLNDIKAALARPQGSSAALALLVLSFQYAGMFETVQESSQVPAADLNLFNEFIFSGPDQRLQLLQLSLENLKSQPSVNNSSILDFLKQIFENDKKWTLVEVLLYLNAEKILFPHFYSEEDSPQHIEKMTHWFIDKKNMDFGEVQRFIKSWTSAPVQKRQEVFAKNSLLSSVQNENTQEEFKLLRLLFDDLN